MPTRTITATVSGTSPLTVAMDGEVPPVDVPAQRVNTYTPTVDDRVRIELRTPLPPLILGQIT